MDSNESIWHIVKQSIKKSKKLLTFSVIVMMILSIALYSLFEINTLELYLNKFILIFGFSATIYSVLLTILLYHFISFSDTEFMIDSNKYVERNKEIILNKALSLSNFLKEGIQLIHTNEKKAVKVITADIREDLLYLKNLNKKHVNEKTSLYKCRREFSELDTIISDTNITQVKDLCTIEVEKLDEMWRVLIALTTNLNTIFNKE